MSTMSGFQNNDDAEFYLESALRISMAAGFLAFLSFIIGGMLMSIGSTVCAVAALIRLERCTGGQLEKQKIATARKWIIGVLLFTLLCFAIQVGFMFANSADLYRQSFSLAVEDLLNAPTRTLTWG